MQQLQYNRPNNMKTNTMQYTTVWTLFLQLWLTDMSAYNMPLIQWLNFKICIPVLVYQPKITREAGEAMQRNQPQILKFQHCFTKQIKTYCIMHRNVSQMLLPAAFGYYHFMFHCLNVIHMMFSTCSSRLEQRNM